MKTQKLTKVIEDSLIAFSVVLATKTISVFKGMDTLQVLEIYWQALLLKKYSK